MADLLVVGSGSDGIVNSVNMLHPHMPAPAPTASPRGNIRGPRMIMQERQEREARKAERERLEREQMEKAQAEQDARVSDEQKRQAARRAAERERAAIAAATTASASQHTRQSFPNTFSNSAPQEVDPAIQRRQQRAEQAASGSSGQLAPPPAIKQQVSQPSQNLQPPQQQQQQQQVHQQEQPQQRPLHVPQSAQLPAQQSVNRQIPVSSAVPPVESGIPAASAGQTRPPVGTEGINISAGIQPRHSFPHAFERWEALSAHWEGLTSFWIRQLQQRSEEIDQDPLNRQLARQVTDLSAAGANLFHAVVELQRLRASSERKFQRWFHEMRGDMERNTEVQSMLEAAIQEERRGRAEAIREAVENERSNSKIQKQLAEMRKELAISKDEARRAWEELGRREQEERDRLIALQEGRPTTVGGVQVVPMMQGQPARMRASSSGSHDRQPQKQQPPPPPQTQVPQQQPQYQQHPATAQQQSSTPHHYQQGDPAPQQAQQQQQQQQQKPASALEQLPSQQYYQQPQQEQQAYSHAPDNFTEPSAVGDAYYRQAQGPFPEGAPQDSSKMYEEEKVQYELPSSGSSYPPSASHHYYTTPTPADYSGQGFGEPGWEAVPRHHHPTRLSDVIEEDDERSRTSASQVSRADR
ncbi:hypothetical protein SEPCBS119000_002590 [Sporothrix epigloea]|uniref:Uncharacterized protein n=1 Tax=Sporothrix epigloea TaxID=1892477 RepID=A0ABP0DGZ3_9PEZI